MTGCTKVSPLGCQHCYAERFSERFRSVKGHPYEMGFDLTLRPERLDHPLRWKKPRRVFVNSMSDLFHEDVPDEFIDRVFVVMSMTGRHTFQVLTKRAEPLLGMIDFGEALNEIDWVIVGGESGPGARPMNPDWVRSIRDQCSSFCTPFFFKQWGGRTPKANGNTLDGRQWQEYPVTDSGMTAGPLPRPNESAYCPRIS